MCNVHHIVTDHTEGQISRNKEHSLVDDLTRVHSENTLLTSCQLYFLVPLSSFLAHLSALSHIYIYIYIAPLHDMQCTVTVTLTKYPRQIDTVSIEMAVYGDLTQ